MTTAHPKTPAPSNQDQPTLKMAWYRILDFMESWFRRKRKEISSKRKFGPGWRNYVRPGRKYSRIAALSFTGTGLTVFAIRPEPGWEWYCPQGCGYSITQDPMAACPNCCFRPGAPE